MLITNAINPANSIETILAGNACVYDRAMFPFCPLRPVCRLATFTSADETSRFALDVHLREFRYGNDMSGHPARWFGLCGPAMPLKSVHSRVLVS